MTKDLTTGKIMPILVNFTVPLVLGNLFQLIVRRLTLHLFGCRALGL